MSPFAWTGYDEALPAHRVMQSFLVLDVQYSSRHAEELLAGIEAYRRGESEAYDGAGNGYEFDCRPEGLHIDCLYEGEPLTPVLVDYDTAIQALSEWARMCRGLEAGH